jgi:hypothetical protein
VEYAHFVFQILKYTLSVKFIYKNKMSAQIGEEAGLNNLIPGKRQRDLDQGISEESLSDSHNP